VAAADGEVDFMTLLLRDLILLLGDVAVDDGIEHIQRTHRHAIDFHRPVDITKADLDQADSGLVLAIRKVQRLGKLPNTPPIKPIIYSV